MKDKDIDITTYDKIIFVDASGDDGLTFKENSCDGSSFCYVVSCLVIDPSDFDYNQQVLCNMKTALNLPITTELKSTTLKRHRFANNAYFELSKIHGEVFSFVVFKKKLYENDMEYANALCNTKHLSGFTHAFPLFALRKTKIVKSNDKALIVIDNMKKAETAAVADCYKTLQISYEKYNNQIIYRDSKSENFPLIQLADVIAGTIRNYFEGTLYKQSLQNYCIACRRKKAMCIQGPAYKAWKQLNFHEKDKITLSLHKNANMHNLILPVAITTLPYFMFRKYEYINCYLGDLRHKKRN
ncbi:MAG: DUF3800 domain-containing protein [Clostridium sp.]|nr:DUF3800 domain-containing protein [Clostridium sp.]MCM1399605.1 DUF3800 domain-containing protein [Clostridium sp.]MCM1460159.1 DUF3800 domain-containing protein [Bacteroides sp.]